MFIWRHGWIEIEDSFFFLFRFRYTALTALGITQDVGQIRDNFFI